MTYRVILKVRRLSAFNGENEPKIIAVALQEYKRERRMGGRGFS
jgi:hypothetical protein